MEVRKLGGWELRRKLPHFVPFLFKVPAAHLEVLGVGAGLRARPLSFAASVFSVSSVVKTKTKSSVAKKTLIKPVVLCYKC